MSNMSYCAFENTYNDLDDLYGKGRFDDDPNELSDSELRYRERIIELCKDIADEYGKDE